MIKVRPKILLYGNMENPVFSPNDPESSRVDIVSDIRRIKTLICRIVRSEFN